MSSDFFSGFWSIYISVVILAGVIGCGVFLWVQDRAPTTPGELTGHVWDETLAEYGNPLPVWWRWLFYLTVVFSLAYLAMYPGLGDYAGQFGWTSRGQYNKEMAEANAKYDPLFAQFQSQDLTKLAADPKAQEMGKSLFLTYCAQCHGADGQGAKGFPNLTDGDWLWGGEPAQIETTILEGRHGVMPAYGGNPEAVGGASGAREVAQYVRSLSGLAHDSILASKGKERFTTVCAACHGAEGKGNPAMGAPNLTDKTWLYGSKEATLVETITKGRANQMPAHKEFLGEAKVHLLAAYVYGLSHTASREKAEAAATTAASVTDIKK